MITLRFPAPLKTFSGFIKYGVILLYFMAGLIIFDDYGIPWDENTQRNTGIVFSKALTNQLGMGLFQADTLIPELETYSDREFGAVYEMLLFGIERLQRPSDMREVFLFRHFLVFLTFSISLLVLWIIIEKRTRNWIWGFAGFALVGLHPRLFADAFYNSKDIILLAFFIFSFYPVQKYLLTSRRRYLFWAGILSALTFNIRPAGILIPALLSVIILIRAFVAQSQKKPFTHYLWQWLILSFFFMGVSILFNPYLWSDPLAKSWEILTKFLNYSTVQTAGNAFFMGKYLPADQLPWYYIFVWIFISTPFFTTLLIGFGLVAAFTIVGVKNRNESEPDAVIFTLLWGVIPLVLVVGFGSTLYDGWRHLYFLYPGLVLTGIYAFHSGLMKFGLTIRGMLFIRYTLLISLIIAGTESLLAVIRLHPYQYTFFNFTIQNPEKKYELDYWGVSCYDQLKYITLIKTHDTVTVRPLNLPAFINSWMLKEEDRKRICFENSVVTAYGSRLDSYYPVGETICVAGEHKYADFFLSNYRDTRSPVEIIKYLNRYPPYDKPVMEIKSGKTVISGIYRVE